MKYEWIIILYISFEGKPVLRHNEIKYYKELDWSAGFSSMIGNERCT